MAQKWGTSGLDDVLEELRLSAGSLNWSMDEAFELVGQFRAWWDENKYRLHRDMPKLFGSPADRARRTTWMIVSALSEMLAQQPIDQDGEVEGALLDFVSDLTAQGMPTTRLEVATLAKSSDGREQLIDRIAAGMLNSEHDDVLDALSAARLLAIAVTEQESQGEFAKVGTMLVRGVEWRHRPALMGQAPRGGGFGTRTSVVSLSRVGNEPAPRSRILGGSKARNLLKATIVME